MIGLLCFDLALSIQVIVTASAENAVRDHFRALAQCVEVDQKELRIMGSKSVLLRTLVAAESVKTAGFGVPSTRHDSNVWPSEGDALSARVQVFQSIRWL